MNSLLDNLLIIDIESVPSAEKYALMDERMREQWDKKSTFLRNEDELSSAELFEERAGIFAEFGKIICIGMGFFTYSANELHFRATCLKNHDEKALLEEFKQNLARFPEQSLKLCAHNGKEFDYPFLCRRMLVNGLSLPPVLDIGGKKPWEIALLDTMEMWKFGDRKSFTSLDLLASLFNIESSKSDIDGSMVADTYYREKDLDKIAGYCSRDVVVTGQVFLRLNQMDALPVENVHLIKG